MYIGDCDSPCVIPEKMCMCKESFVSKQSALCSHGMEFSYHKQMLMLSDTCHW